jgi:hypothetical protein
VISDPHEPVPSAADIELIEAEAWAELQLGLPQELRSRLGIRVQRVAGAVLLLSSEAPVLAINRVIGLGLVAPLTERQLDAVCAEYAAAGVERYIVQWSPAGEPSCVPEWLANRGFTIVSRTAKLYRRTDTAPREVAADREMDVVEIGPSEAESYERIVAGPLGVPDGLGPGIRSTIGRPGWRYYMVLHRQRPIAGAALYARGQQGWFGLGATMESDRRRGAQTALLARRLRDAAAGGCVWVSADTLVDTVDRPNPSYRNMRRAGFATLYERPNFLVDLRGSQSTARPSA